MKSCILIINFQTLHAAETRYVADDDVFYNYYSSVTEIVMPTSRTLLTLFVGISTQSKACASI